jgi:glyoxylase-like metal-dependent hydrolase (beta-lactamase superfamily II)
LNSHKLNSLIAIILGFTILSLSLTVLVDEAYSLRNADRDYDGIIDEDDQCPQISETFNKFEDEDGCPDTVIEEKSKYEFPDTDGDGFEDRIDKCVNLPETFNDYLDHDGCPERIAQTANMQKDSDDDSVPDSIDACPTEKETINEFKDGDGCPDSFISSLPGRFEGNSLTPSQCLSDKIPVLRVNSEDPVCVNFDTATKWEEYGIAEIIESLPTKETLAVEEMADEFEPEMVPEIPKKILESIPAAGNIYMLIGTIHSIEGNIGGNIGVSTGSDGLLIIDAGMEFALDDIKEKLNELKTCPTCGDVKFLLNTHWHVDHVSNNAHFGEHETIIVAHNNVRDLLSSPQELKAFGMKFDSYPEEALPIVTFDDSVSLHFNDEKIKVNYLPNGHTDSDSIVYFTESNVLHLGDLFFNGMFPFVDLEHGGSVQGLTENVEMIINEYPQDVKIIPGHGTLSDMDDLVSYHIMLVETTKTVQDKMDLGAPLNEIQAMGLPERWSQWEEGSIDEATWIQIIYASLS